MDVELGFIKKSASWKLRSKFFPSKIGGKPAWLTLNNLPEPSDLLCTVCKKPYVFLLQIYANIDANEDTFHRSLYIFICSNGMCIKKFSNQCFVVFRNQLPRRNDFFSYEPPVIEERLSASPNAAQYQIICDICGCKAVLTCENCSNRHYCTEYHQKLDMDWMHKDQCCKDFATKKKKSNPFILPEYEIECDTEDLPPEKAEKSDEEKMREYQQFMKSDKAPKELQDAPLDDLDLIMKNNDKAFNKFRKRIEYAPEQILRYQRGGNPLFVSAEFVPKETDIPPCECGARRIFEFQVMSQLLLYLSLDSVGESPDWGTLLVYTCSQSCDRGTGAYVKEFLWKQDFSENK